MKKLFCLGSIALMLVSCGGGGNGELIGVQGRNASYDAPPYGMVLVPKGSYRMGPSDQDVPWSMTSQSKTVSVPAFYMDETEITNNEYRQFVYWVRDSLAYRLLGEQIDAYLISEDQYGEAIDPPFINWDEPIVWDGEEEKTILEDLYYPEHERINRRREFDTRKFVYNYFWVDYKQAAQKFTFENENRRHYNYKTGVYDGEVYNLEGKLVPIKDRSSFIMYDQVHVYPDTLCWVSDFSYSYNEPMANMYFWHPSYDNYPVVGVTWKQATAFCVWRTNLMNNYLIREGGSFVQDFRLPLEGEWEYAARGGNDLAVYPWGGPYTRNDKGCFLANFKPLRGNYIGDGGLYTVAVAIYEPNDFGLYDMSGNVAEWTANAFDESEYSYSHDLSPDYKRNALPDDLPVMKRKVVRGGSWKDIAYYMQNGTRTYEYQDSAKSYIGFRCVRSYMGPDETGATSNVY
ncbi:MAG: SUMF1/EgtB/PvdO family nonheme iron enzyme [Salinivirgaceae bacterium]|nr:SUMF1/EgtB/PvdO family nonheme iron enzyme [Salinivirgaceae bacterium]